MRAIVLNPADAPLAESELVLNADGSVYHLALRPEQLGDVVLVCGDPGRVPMISRHFDRIDHRVTNREFVTHTGELHGTRITAMATGIGTDNIDIVLNELDALVNIDLVNRTPLAKPRSVRIIRLGTCGALHEDVPVDAMVVSSHGIGLDSVMHFYACEPADSELRILNAFLAHTAWPDNLPLPYVAEGDAGLVEILGRDQHVGLTVTANGFYGPQGRALRLPPSVDGLNDAFGTFAYEEHRILNYEMETSALYGLAGALGHRACTVCTVVANRLRKEYSRDHQAAIDRMIAHVLERSTGAW